MARTVLVGVTGCIAAYKSAEIVRGLQKKGCRVKVVMTEHATHFVDPLTYRSLTHEPVAVGLFDDPSDPIHHISLAEEADCFLIAPCTANVAAKMANGIADDLLTTTALACTAPIVIAPAMNVHMYEAAATQRNLAILRERGVRIVEAESGYLACGDIGKGRLAGIEVIVRAALRALDGVSGGASLESVDGAHDSASFERSSSDKRPQDLSGFRILVTAGPTQEPIDPVRFITNRSSGKMGYAIAEVARDRGAAVTLVSGPVALAAPEGVEVVSVRTALEMLDASRVPFSTSDVAVFTAAVADMRPSICPDHKLKKGREADDAALSSLTLVPNPDIIATLAASKRPNQVVVGFAAETEDVAANARCKLASKHADLIVGNKVGDGLTFGQDQSRAVLVNEVGEEDLPLMSKRELADRVLDRALGLQRGKAGA